MSVHRRTRRHGRVLAGGCLAATALLAAVVPANGQGAPSPVHVPPVTAPISDPFRAPETPYGPGNRGLKYDTDPGTEIRASADGEVVFAGRVAWELHVTVLHADGVRTSYSFLDEIHVVVGQRVRQGERIGLAGEVFHFGARLGDTYFDPATLFATGDVQVELLPLEIPPGATPDEEAAALWALVIGSGGGGFSLPLVGEAVGWLADRARLVGHYAIELNPVGRAVDVGWAVGQRSLFAPPCTDEAPPPRAAAGTDRVAVLVGGLGSSSASASIDHLRLDELGYEDGDIVRFSYAGGRTPGTGVSFISLQARPYGSADTQSDLQIAGAHLADMVEQVAAERPDATVDLYAHSMGGLVTRLALLELEHRGVSLDRLGVVATFASPHDGADLATAVRGANTTLAGRTGLELTERLVDTGIDPGSVAVAQLSETSSLVEELRRADVPDDVEFVSIAASGDVIVPTPHSRLDGARNITVAGAGLNTHSDMVASDTVTHELGLALAEMPQRCVAILDAVNDELLGHSISYVQDLVGYSLTHWPG